MKHYITWISLAACLALMPTAGALAAAPGDAPAPAPQAQSLQQLLDQVKADLNHQTAEDQARLNTFIRARDQQAALLKQAQQDLAAADARAKRLQGQFDANEKQLDSLSTTLSTREGNLGQVFGIVRQTAGQFKGTLASSLISVQYPDRGLFAAKLAASTALPSIHDLKTLWYDMLQQMVEQGRVVKFSADVTEVNGSKIHRDVVRVGPFNTVMGDKYLQYEPTSNSLVVIAHQPSGRYTDSAQRLYNASGNDLVNFGVDPLRGQLLTLLIQVPTFHQRLNEGGAVGYTILVLFAIALLVCLERGIFLTIANIRIKRQLKSGTPNTDNALGRVLSVYDQNRRDDVETLGLKLDEAIMKEVPALEARQNFIKLIAAVGPLLGLLGTVVGMVQTFTSITLFGTSNPAFMAAGISFALVTTVEGLVTAIPLVFLHSFINAKSRELVHILEEQSAGILAAQAEKQSGGAPAKAGQ
ncbi:MAG: MotA/TolQ/ExbB proton channel family protein [Gammaproteobacteria bacterium]